MGLSLDETVQHKDLRDLLWVFQVPKTLEQIAESVLSPMYPDGSILNTKFQRTSAYLTHPVFNIHHSETDMVRYWHSFSAFVVLASWSFKVHEEA